MSPMQLCLRSWAGPLLPRHPACTADWEWSSIAPWNIPLLSFGSFLQLFQYPCYWSGTDGIVSTGTEW